MTWRDFEARLVLKAWQDEAFRQALLSNPKAALESETGVKLPKRVKVKVLEETPRTLYLVLPAFPLADAKELLFRPAPSKEKPGAPDKARS